MILLELSDGPNREQCDDSRPNKVMHVISRISPFTAFSVSRDEASHGRLFNQIIIPEPSVHCPVLKDEQTFAASNN